MKFDVLNFLENLDCNKGIDLQSCIKNKLPRILFPKLYNYESEDLFHELLDELIDFLREKGRLQKFSEIIHTAVLHHVIPQHEKAVKDYFRSYHYKHPTLLFLREFVDKSVFVPVFTDENYRQFKDFPDRVYRLNIPINPSLIFHMKDPTTADFELALKSFVDMFENKPIQLDREWLSYVSINSEKVVRGLTDGPLVFLSNILQVFRHRIVHRHDTESNRIVSVTANWGLFRQYISREFLKKHTQKFCENLDDNWGYPDDITCFIDNLVDMFSLEFTNLGLNKETQQKLINIYLNNLDFIEYKDDQLSEFLVEHFGELDIQNKIRYFYQVLRQVDIADFCEDCLEIFDRDYDLEQIKQIQLSLITDLVFRLSHLLNKLNNSSPSSIRTELSQSVVKVVQLLFHLKYTFKSDEFMKIIQSIEKEHRNELTEILMKSSVNSLLE